MVPSVSDINRLIDIAILRMTETAGKLLQSNYLGLLPRPIANCKIENISSRDLTALAAQLPRTIEIYEGILIWYDKEALKLFTNRDTRNITSISLDCKESGSEYKTSDSEATTNVVNDILLELSKPRTVAHMICEELRTAVLAPTAVERQRTARAIDNVPRSAFTPVGREKGIRFDRIITASTDEQLGDCSYLDTCFKGRGCKFVHYRIEHPSRPEIEAHPPLSTSVTGPIQSIRCDILKFDLGLLGNDYAALVIDPPWDIHTSGQPSGQIAGGQTAAPGIVRDRDILELRIESLQKAGVCFLWVTGRAVDIGRQCLNKWGYTQIEELIWVKTNQLGRTICTGRTGHWLNHTKEHVLVGVKGDPAWLQHGLDADVLVSTALGRSQKPVELYKIIDRMVGVSAKKLELFGRQSNMRPGWLTLGDEVDKNRIADPELKAKLARSSNPWSR